MKSPVPLIALGVLLASGSPVVQAKRTPPNAPANPAAAQPVSSVDLTFRPAPPTGMPSDSLPANALDLALRPGTAMAANATSTPPGATATSSDVVRDSEEVKRVAHWVGESRDNAGLPYLLVDKANARVYAYDGAGRLQGSAPVLLGLARGDKLLAPNSATMEQMPPSVRITPAGRFVSRLAVDSHGVELLVMDYDASISLHAVVKGTPQEHRAERLNSATSDDNRISFGCINVPTTFYSGIVSPTFKRTKGIVYVLPETGPAALLFGFQPTPGASGGTGPLAAHSVDGQSTRATPAAVAK